MRAYSLAALATAQSIRFGREDVSAEDPSRGATSIRVATLGSEARRALRWRGARREAPWIAEMVGDLPTLLRARDQESAEAAVARRRREAVRSWEAALPIAYQWARLEHPFLRSRVKLEQLPSKPPSAQRVVFFGDAGLGKTSLAVALLRALAQTAIATTSVDHDEVVRAIARRFHFASAHRLGTAGLAVHGDADAIQIAMRARVLLLDDLGSERGMPSNPITDIIAERHGEDRVTWITTGLSAKEIVDRYGGGVARRVLEGASLIRLGS